jgi:O-antigen/teichoic acid export membrane protein
MMLNAGFGVYALPAATFLSESARLIGHVYWIQRLVPALRLTYHVSRDVLRAMFSLSSKVFVYALANTVYEQMDKIIIATLLTTTLLTDYDISYRLHTLVFALTTMISPFLVPAASSLQAINDTRELHRLFVRVTLYTAALTVPAALLVIVLAQPLTVYWIGVDYAHTVPATQLFISYLLFWFILRIGQNMLVGINQLDVVIPAFILTTIINLLVSVTLVPSLGVMGVIVGTVCGNLIALVPYLRAFRQHFNLTLHDILSGVVLRVYPQALVSAGAVLGLTQLHTPGNLFEVGLYGAGGLMGFALLFFLTGMPSDEKQLLQRFATRFNPVR